MPVPDQASIIDDIDIERTRSPGPAAPSASPSLDRFQQSKQRFRRKARVDQCYRVYVSRLTRPADGFRLVKWRDRNDSYISALNFAYGMFKRLCRRAPYPGTICTKSYQNLPTREQLHTPSVTPMLSKQPSSRRC